MFCSQCGHQASGRFCSQCGSPLAEGGGNWASEVRYDVLMRVPEVRSAIHQQAQLARKGITGEQFLALCDNIVPLGVPLELIASIVQPIYASWGIGTGKQRTEVVHAPTGEAIVRVLCSLALRGQQLRCVQQAADGCSLEAALPSDLWSLEGDLLVTVRGLGESQTEVQAATRIKGQLYDWGKSRRCLDRLFADLHQPPPRLVPIADAA